MVQTSPLSPHPITPDGRYFIVRGRLWRMANPELSEEDRVRLVADLMQARREVGMALRSKDLDAAKLARQAADVAKHDLGERGLLWWNDGTPDYNRRMVRNTPYAGWYVTLSIE
jgi:hypothetical protein